MLRESLLQEGIVYLLRPKYQPCLPIWIYMLRPKMLQSRVPLL
jgi:hypothetical protein